MIGLFFWLLGGDFGYNLKDRAVPLTLQLLLRQHGVSDLLTGFLLATLPQLILVLVGPVVAYHSDRHRGRWGRRIPFLLVPTPMAVIAMVGLAYGPAIGRWLHLALGRSSPGEDTSIIVTLAIFWALFELAAIICNSVLVSLITDVVPRGMIGRFFGLFRFVSLLAGILFSYFVLGHVERHYTAVFLAIAAVYGISFTAMCLKVKEGTYPPPPPRASLPGRGLRRRVRQMVRGVVTYLRECFAQPYYRWIFGAYALSAMAAVPANLFTLFFAQSFHISMATYGKLTAVQFVLSLVQAYPIGWLADRFHPLRITMVALALIALGNGMAFLLVRDATSFEIAFVLCGTLWGFWGTAVAALPSALLARPRFATLDSAKNISGAVGQMVIAPVCGWSLDLSNHDYHYVYVWVSVLAFLSLLATVVVNRYFVRYGGQANYVAPE
ncbi:MAG: MFS transporter [Opitutaceae bacterium]